MRLPKLGSGPVSTSPRAEQTAGAGVPATRPAGSLVQSGDAARPDAQLLGGPARPGVTPSARASLRPDEAARFGVAGARAEPLQGSPAVVRSRQVAPTADEQEFLEDLVRAYYPVDHPKLHVVSGVIDLDRVGVGRKDETGRLRKVALSVPYALGGEWKFSPMAQAKGFEFDLSKALEQHATLCRFLLDRGVEVHLSLQVQGASEAVYNTDVVTAIGRTAMIGRPKHEARGLERDGYTGGVDLARFAGPKAPIEFGDVILFERDGKQYVFQGYDSWRGTEASIEAMGHALEYMKRAGQIGEYEHVPVRLSGEGTLHLDYVFNYAGTGDRRVMTIYEEGLADPKQAARLAEILGVPEARVIRVSEEEMLAGAANLSSFGPDEVMYIDNPHSKRVAQRMGDAGLTVHGFEFSQMSQKDGTLHCCVGQLARD